jgi:hypothetical protein
MPHAHDDDHDEIHDGLVTDLDTLLARQRATEPYALAFSGVIGRDSRGTFTFSTSGSCQTRDELFAYLSEPGTLQHVTQIAALLAQPQVLELLRALVCEREPEALGASTQRELIALGVLEPGHDGTPRVTDRGFGLFLWFYSASRACRR